MGGTKAGGINVRLGMLKKFGSEEAMHDWYVKIGRMGGAKGTTDGFAANPELARKAGKKGGVNSWAKLSTAERTLRAQRVWDGIRKRESL